MSFKRGLLLYLSILLICIFTAYWFTDIDTIIRQEGLAEFRSVVPSPVIHHKTGFFFRDYLEENYSQPLVLLIIQILIILVLTQVFGYFLKMIRQPAVIGEITAGIVLGPSLLGLFFPGLFEFLFPPGSLGNLQVVSQLGLILFMFIVGLELDLISLRQQATGAVIISHASIIVPFTLGIVGAGFMYKQYAPDHISLLSFALFVGVAMSITAFPVLARILKDRGLTKTRLGVLALTCAATDDVTAWCILAIVIAIVKTGNYLHALFTIILALAYVMIMLFVARPLLKKSEGYYTSSGKINKHFLAIVFVILLLSSLTTELIGIHALFGAFLAGTIMPLNLEFRKSITNKIEPVSTVLLLPVFFVFTGLRTQIGLLNEMHHWVACFWIIVLAIIGKFGASAIVARLVGNSWKESNMLGALMNTRGLMELIVLNIGFELGILSTEVFTMMVIMALVTTFMTCPLLDVIERLWPVRL